MKRTYIKYVFALSGMALIGCGSSSKSTSTDPVDATPAGKTASTSTSTTTISSAGTVGVISLAMIPSLDSFLKSKSTTATLADELLADDRSDGYSLVTGTPPKFTDIAASMATYLSGDVSALSTAIETNRTASNWDDMKANLKKFLDAETKCAVMENTARIVQRMREDTAPLCVLQAVGPVGDKVYKVKSGTAIADLTKVFVPDVEDKILQIGMTDKGQTKYEIVQISGTKNNPNGYKAVYSTCLTSGKKAFRQNSIDINNTTGVVTFKSFKNGAIDDKGVKPNAAFTMTGYVVADGSGGVVPDTSKSRTVTYSSDGAMGQLNSTNQGTLTISANELAATFFKSESGTDKSGKDMTRTDKTALDVQYTGTGTSDLVIYQGAGHSIITFAGVSLKGDTINMTDDRSIGFSFDNTASPQYTTTTTSTYVTNIAAVNFTTDAILKQTAPTAPDMTLIDSTACSATPTTLLQWVDKPEENGVYSAALVSCNTFPAEKGGNMCDDLRNQERTVNNAMRERKAAKGSATD